MERTKNQLTLQDIKDVCKALEIPYAVEEVHETIYVYDKNDWKDHQEDKEKFVAYLRISHFGEREDMLYTRFIGNCDWMSMSRVWTKIGQLGHIID